MMDMDKLREFLGAPLLSDFHQGSRSVLHAKFNSVSELVAYGDAPIDNPNWGINWSRMRARVDDGSERHWFGVNSYEEALGIALRGDGMQEFTDKVRGLAGRLLAESGLDPEMAGIHYAESGLAPDIGRFLSGEPENMLALDDPIPPKIVRLVSNVTISSAASANDIIQRGALAYAIIEALEMRGIRCEVSTMNVSPYFVIETYTKHPNDPLTESASVFMLCHPASYRVFQFAAQERMPGDIPRLSGSYCIGSSSGGYGEVVEVPANLRGDIYLPVASSGESWDALRKRFRAIVEAQGVELKEAS